THVELEALKYGITKDSVILLEQIRTIDKRRLKEKIGHLSEELMKQVDTAIQISFGLIGYT
ncbi:MAG TPA: type II toxin-antitoxin system PemK/MazF family toxin, partial [Bacillota bacterium]|nr:type II toxin-antitoxin system PemK/MazF family toxin [Bacillota bacterium]